LRTAYLGTSDFAATVLRRLAASPHAPALVVTPPDSRQGRGRKETPPPAAEAARELGLQLLQVADVNGEEGTAALRTAAPDVVTVCAFGQLLGQPLLDEHPMLNVHPSLIPRWRGAAPIERAIMAGDRETGTTIMGVSAELDAGPVALQEPMAVEPGDYYDDLAGRLAEQGGELLVRALDMREAGELELVPQDEADATYAEKIDPSERRLDPGRDAAELAWKVRALNPHIGTHIELPDGERLGVRRARPVEDAPPQGALRFDEEEGTLVLGTAQAGLEIQAVQPRGKSTMVGSELARGYPVPVRAV
jgi:methionyl-tRNA formyltransferase